jgi:hypothetical protein
MLGNITDYIVVRTSSQHFVGDIPVTMTMWDAVDKLSPSHVRMTIMLSQHHVGATQNEIVPTGEEKRCGDL